MKIKNKLPRSRKKIIILALIIAIGLVIGSFFIVRALSNSQEEKSSGGIDYNSPTKPQQDNADTIKSNSINTENSKPNISGSDQPSAPVASEGDSRKTVSLTITTAEQNQNLLQIRAFVGTVTNTGTCTLELSKPGQTTVVRSVEVQPSATTSTCKGFDISTTDLTKGDWSVVISFQNDTLIGSATQEIVIQ